MKRLFLFTLCVTFSLLAFPKGEKVIGKSAKRAPGWVYGMERDYVITSAEASTMEIARSMAMQQVKERILSSVAEHVESETSISNNETVTELDIQSLSVFAKQIRTKSADVPFLKNVSEAHVTDYYWEKIQKSNKKIAYVYHIKYPFSELEIRVIVKEWQEQHQLNELQAADIDAQLDMYSAVKFSSMSSIEQMQQTVNDVLQLQGQLPDQETRRSERCSAVLEGFKRQLADIQIRVKDITREYVDYALYLGDKKISCQLQPQMQSNCLTQMSYEPIEGGGRVTFNFQSACYESESNYMELSYDLCGKKISSRINLVPSAEPQSMNDEQRVALTPVVLDKAIPASVTKQLVNKMQQIVAKSGCAGSQDSRFVITCSVDELAKEVMSTAPLMYVYTLNFNFYIGDGVDGVLFSATSIEAKAAGENLTKAYLSALKMVQPNNPVFKPFVDKGRKRIAEYSTAPAAQQEYMDVNDWKK